MTMKTAIIYYSKHHGNTKKLADAIAAKHDVELIDCLNDVKNLSDYDRIGLASGIYAGHSAKQLQRYAKEHLPEHKDVFIIVTSAAPADRYFNDLRKIAEEKHCKLSGTYQCQVFNTFGPFKLIGGTGKGHPTQAELDAVVKFYESLK